MPIKKISELRQDQIDYYLDLLGQSASAALKNIENITKAKSPMDVFRLLKFNQVGCDPLDSSIKLNLIEQLNQTFTYMASFLAARFIFENHKFNGDTIALNLGTQGGSDIESSDKSIVGEVFATTNIQNNGKILKDIAKVKAVSHAEHRYVFLIAPSIEVGRYDYKSKNIELDGVNVISLSRLEQDDQYPFVTRT